MIWFRWSQFYFHIPIILRLLLSVSFFMILFGYLIHLVEPTHFESVFDGIWWAIVTGSTVGYGDYVPLSFLGKAIAILLILTGGGLLTFYMVTLSATSIQHEEKLSNGQISFKGKNHIIIVGWNERTKQLITFLQADHRAHPVVLIDKSLLNLPYQKHMLHFIHDDPTRDACLDKANIKDASIVLITADPNKNESEADRQTILTALAVRGLNNEVPIVTELLTNEQKENAKRAGATTIIRSNDFMSNLFFQELRQIEGIGSFDIYIQLLKQMELSFVPAEKEISYFLQQTFHQKEGRFLLGVIREEKILFDAKLIKSIKKKDTLILMKPKKQAPLSI
ncbi:potassium channel family protein [Saliterribacillus persicus]|uniref:Voltage-gated potassium channel n=1 Tax=Saliterribacillus persicus TaxID=930114 RepID=A0A368XKB5_9BACI|nr:potassium channel family protein [Saliterribacillus persicus]RCW66927.1 voltage-gated potassium channel [Saliterribacillus persicus]